MLVELVVENVAVVEKIRARFHAGLNLLTGETGSGKSIVVDALMLLLGGRASADLVRSGAERARVSGIFQIPPDRDLLAVLEQTGVETEDGELIVEREVLANGKSRAFLGGRTVTAGLLREMAPWLGDIHGQHDQQLLFSGAAQRDMLDAFGQCAPLAEKVAEVYRSWKAVARELEDLEKNEQERLRLADLWLFQRREIEAVHPKPEEEDALGAERAVLANVTRLAEGGGIAYAALYDAPESALAQLRIAVKKLEELVRIDPSLEELRESLKPAEFALQEAGRTLARYLDRLEADPARLEEVEARLAALEKLKRKYGPALADVIAYLAQVTADLDKVENADAQRAKLDAERARLAREYESAAAQLTEARRKAARKLEKRIESELSQLAMERSRFVVNISAAEWAEAGADAIEFLISANPGEEPRPLDRVASGGELSRVALAIKAVTVPPVKGIPRTLVFDEVDSGIGGAVAETVGRRLKLLAQHQQVLCVTHLAQIASFADHHYSIEKREQKGRTIAHLEELDAAARVREIARMIAGSSVKPEALKHAERMVAASR